jgi:transposase-like protein
MTKKRRRRTADEWSEVVARWQGSGQSAEDFAQAEECHPKTLYWWSRRLKKAPATGSTNVPVFAPVRVVGHAALGSTVSIKHDSGFTITVDRDTDRELLDAVLKSVSAC